jgi:hypothetical protein
MLVIDSRSLRQKLFMVGGVIIVSVAVVGIAAKAVVMAIQSPGSPQATL